jgi:hypothetical protein
MGLKPHRIQVRGVIILADFREKTLLCDRVVLHLFSSPPRRPSQHRLAMQHATDKTVLGDFNDASFDYYGVQSRFFFICKGRYSRLHLSVILCLSRANAGVPS